MQDTTDSSSVGQLQLISSLDGVESPLFTFQDQSIVIRKGLTFEEWRSGLPYWRDTERNFKLARATYMAYGVIEFGQIKVDEALGQLSFDLPMVNEINRINSIPEEIRRPNLTAEHYIVIAKAGLKKKQQIHWANVASEQNLTPSTLKVSIEQGEVTTPEVAKAKTTGIMNVNGIAMELTIWIRRMGGIEGIDKLDETSRGNIANELEEGAKLWLHLRGLKAVTSIEV